MSFNEYDKATKPTVDVLELEQAKFLKTLLDAVAVRVGNEQGAPLYVSEVAAQNVYISPIANVVNVPDKDTKTVFTFTQGTKKFLIRSEKVTEIKYNYSEALFDAGEKLTITSGGYLLWDLDEPLAADIDFVFETDKDNIDLEVTQWK